MVWKGHVHDPAGRIQDNIFFSFFSQYGNNVKVWSTNQSIDNYDIQRNIVFNGGALSEALSRKFNFFVVGNNPNAAPGNLLVKDNYTFAGRTTTSPACNAFGPHYITGTLGADGLIEVPMTGHSFEQAIGSTQAPVSQFPEFGAFVIRRALSPLHRSGTGRR